MKQIYKLGAIALVALLGTMQMTAQHKQHEEKHECKTAEFCRNVQETVKHHNLGLGVDDEHHADWWAGGTITLWQDNTAKRTLFGFRPEIGRFLNDKWGVGLVGTYEQEGDEARVYGITPFVRRYVFERRPFNIYFDGGVGLSWTETKGRNGSKWGDSTMGFEVGVRPGVCVDLAKGLCLCLRMGFLGYRDSFTTGEDPELTHSGFGFRFAPEELQIGLEFEF